MWRPLFRTHTHTHTHTTLKRFRKYYVLLLTTAASCGDGWLVGAVICCNKNIKHKVLSEPISAALTIYTSIRGYSVRPTTGILLILTGGLRAFPKSLQVDVGIVFRLSKPTSKSHPIQRLHQPFCQSMLCSLDIVACTSDYRRGLNGDSIY
jgi:hypothetical protein